MQNSRLVLIFLSFSLFILNSLNAITCGNIPAGANFCSQITVNSIVNIPSNYVVNITLVKADFATACNGINCLGSSYGNWSIYNSISGNQLYSWLETLPTGNTTLRVWFDLDSNVIANSLNTNLYLAFFPTNQMINPASFTGEAPQIPSGTGTGIYGQYDNGCKVFDPLYQNFTGNVLNSCGSTWLNNGATVNNGLTITMSMSNVITTSNFGNNNSQILDSWGRQLTTSTLDNYEGFGYWFGGVQARFVGWCLSGCNANTRPNTESNGFPNFNEGNLLPNNGFHIFTTYGTNSINKYSFDYGIINSLSVYPLSTQVPITFATGTFFHNLGAFDYIRIRETANGSSSNANVVYSGVSSTTSSTTSTSTTTMSTTTIPNLPLPTTSCNQFDPYLPLFAGFVFALMYLFEDKNERAFLKHLWLALAVSLIGLGFATNYQVGFTQAVTINGVTTTIFNCIPDNYSTPYVQIFIVLFLGLLGYFIVRIGSFIRKKN